MFHSLNLSGKQEERVSSACDKEVNAEQEEWFRGCFEEGYDLPDKQYELWLQKTLWYRVSRICAIQLAGHVFSRLSASLSNAVGQFAIHLHNKH